jgi:hypothetical protein
VGECRNVYVFDSFKHVSPTKRVTLPSVDASCASMFSLGMLTLLHMVIEELAKKRDA